MKEFLGFARRYLLPYVHWYVGGTIALALTNWLSVTIPLYLAEGIDALGRGPEGTALIVRNALLVAAMGLGVIGVRTASRLLFFTPGRLVEAQVKHDLFERMMRQQPAFLDQYPTGDLVSRASGDTNMTRLLGGFVALSLINTFVALVLGGGQMARISPTLAGYVLVPLGLALGFTVVVVGRLRDVMRRMQAQAAVLSDHILISYQGVATVRVMRAAPAFEAQFVEHNDLYLRTTLQRANLGVLVGPMLALASSVNVFLLLYVGGPMAIRGELTVGELVAFTTLAAYMTGPLRGLSFIISLVRQAQASIERLDAILLPAPERPELPSPVQPGERAPALEVRGLGFSYPGAAGAPALAGVDVSLGAGQTLGVFGSTGSGKTTLLRCLTRIYNPPRGTIFVDGVDVLDLDLDAWRRRLAVVPQRAFLFTESVRDNILLGAPDDGRLESVIDRAALAVDLAALPAGADTLVGEAGLTLSGGKRQRVALARGLVRPHALLVLDDVLSAVDHGTERQLIATLRAMPDRPTTIIVANRISALQHADVIVVLDGGRMVDRGTHRELLARPGPYREVWERQAEMEGR